ncbi:MAG: RNA polymerase sigma-70 factor [Candidatus Pseudobacter hemicellulosilyticus]|uniref:RNA polymerase sigma-70 factor n=1 Tax=Candidatus Pseudobacter hemicellulosilyticus TaxID=3121375 RepID=A0AAJ5WKR6_9BACT|nr:MAG: RNA polymerase sigma-70 factor [Pseudobacter sp.]
MHRISEGEEDAFIELYKRYDARLYPFLHKLTRSPQDAREIIQETFLKLWLSRDKLDAVTLPRAYIFRSAANISHNWMKRNLVAQKAEQEHQLRDGRLGTDSTEFRLRTRELQVQLSRIIAGMPEQRQRIYRMHREQGLSTSEIASSLDVSVSTVKNTVAIALKNIRDGLSETGYILFLLLFF